MKHKRVLTVGVSALVTLASLGVLGFGCAGVEASDGGGDVPCVPEAEACGDSYDNDCDGLVDEDCECNPGATQACYTGPAGSEGKGACAPGEQTCGPNGKWGDCAGEVLPAADDACDGVDNNCDGMIDPGCECSPPVPETTQPCYTGPEGTEGVGDCTPGFQICLPDGTWDTECIQEVLPGEEACDNLDNDCDGEVDDMGTKACGVGACQVSVVACTNGKPTPCSPKAPSVEMCDGVDNDCDQLTDESDPNSGKTCDSGLLGACKAGKLSCDEGGLACVPSVQAVPETCDGVDNDCDGVMDDNIPGTGGACSTGYPGACSAGAIQCQNNTIDCFPVMTPSDEVCDGIDNDCDDDTDEGNPGSGLQCSTGALGVCSAGTTNCESGSIVCNANTQSSDEVCDGLDNNCDGIVDENNPESGQSCDTGSKGACAVGSTSCAAGTLVCVQTTFATAETCDNADNDCNGAIDDGNPGGGTSCNTGQAGACATGIQQCQNGQLACKPAVSIFSEDFANNNKGWTFTGGEWSIGPALSSSGHSYGYADPALDHSPTSDNGVAGVVRGGNASTTIHSAYYLTSPVVNVASAPALYLEFWRWLNSDYSPYMVNTVDVWNGSTWVNIWASGASPGVQDAAWSKQSYNVTAYKNAQFQFRFGYAVSSGAYTVAQWNVDDVALTTAQGCF